MDGRQKGKAFLATVLLGVVVYLLITSTEWLGRVDKAMTPYVQYDKGDFCNASSVGSADAQSITNIHIGWEDGDVEIVYSSQERITWIETFVEGEPTQYNSQYYWMNTHSIYIEYRNQDYYAMDEHSHRKIKKNLKMAIPYGYVLDELIVHNTGGKVICEVEAKKKDIVSQVSQTETTFQ